MTGQKPENSTGTTATAAATDSPAGGFKRTPSSMFGGTSSFFSKPKIVADSEAKYAEQVKSRVEALDNLFGSVFNIVGAASIKPSVLVAFNEAWDQLHKLSVKTDEKPGELPTILDPDLLRLAILFKQKILATRQPNWDVATYTDKTFDSYHTVNVADYERSTFNEASPHTFLGFQNQNEQGEYVITKDYFAKDPEILRICTKLGYTISTEPTLAADKPHSSAAPAA